MQGDGALDEALGATEETASEDERAGALDEAMAATVDVATEETASEDERAGVLDEALTATVDVATEGIASEDEDVRIGSLNELMAATGGVGIRVIGTGGLGEDGVVGVVKYVVLRSAK